MYRYYGNTHTDKHWSEIQCITQEKENMGTTIKHKLECPRCGATREVSIAAYKRAKRNNSNCIRCKRMGYLAHLTKEIYANEGRFCVYYIPAHHYVGYSSNIIRRAAVHRNKLGKNIEDFSIVGWFDNKYDAMMLEAEYHKKGYAGSQYDGLTYKRELYAS